MSAVAPITKNWAALLDLTFKATPAKTRLIPVKRYGPLSVQRAFYPEQDVCHAYLLHPPGGVVGGDQIDLKLLAETRSTSLLTTPGATKFYQSAGLTANVNQQMRIQDQASIEFLPQENIYFPGAKVRLHTKLNLAEDASLLIWEKHCFGRPANNEVFDQGHVTSHLNLNVNSERVFSDTQRVDSVEINRASGLRGNAVMGSMLLYGINLSRTQLQQCRDISPSQGHYGITQPQPQLLVIRYMGNSTMVLNDYFIALWELLRPLQLNRPACHPRIWFT